MNLFALSFSWKQTMYIYYLRVKSSPTFVLSNKAYNVSMDLSLFTQPDVTLALNSMEGERDYHNPWINCDSENPRWHGIIMTNNPKQLYTELRKLYTRTHKRAVLAANDFYGRKEIIRRLNITVDQFKAMNPKPLVHGRPESFYRADNWPEYVGTAFDVSNRRLTLKTQSDFWKACGEELEVCKCRIDSQGINFVSVSPLSEYYPKKMAPMNSPYQGGLAAAWEQDEAKEKEEKKLAKKQNKALTKKTVGSII